MVWVFAQDTDAEGLQNNAAQIFREETFGPAIPLFRFGSEAEAIQLANDTEYGLASYFFTKVRSRVDDNCRGSACALGQSSN